VVDTSRERCALRHARRANHQSHAAASAGLAIAWLGVIFWALLLIGIVAFLIWLVTPLPA
jgi:hypothetical protein